MRYQMLLLALVPLLFAGCATGRAPSTVAMIGEGPAEARPRWDVLVTEADRARLLALDAAWVTARAAVRTGLKPQLEREGPLVDPTAALDLPALPPGPYYCRLVRLGGATSFVTYKPDFCSVDGTAKNLAFTKQSGSNLPGGWLFPDTDKRQVFLGTFRAAGGVAGPAYSTMPAHDVAGVVERIGAFRWRLVLTRAGKGALLDIYELVPVTPRVPGAVPAVPEL